MNCIFVDLPTKVRGCVIPNEDGDYTVVLNSRFSHEINVETYLHEVEEHIRRGDLDSRERDVQQIELEAHHIEQETKPAAPPKKRRRRRRRFDAHWREFQELYGWMSNDRMLEAVENRRLEE